MSQRTKAYTVAELIAELQQLPPDALCIVEGCDCNGPSAGAELRYDGTVRLLRDDLLETLRANNVATMIEDAVATLAPK